MAKITPTVGRIVWMYHRNNGNIVLDAFNNQINQPAPGEPLMATICRVLPDGTINVAGFDALGKPYAEHGVTLLQEGDKTPEGGRYATWMPYQQAQAAKAAAEPTTSTVV